MNLHHFTSADARPADAINLFGMQITRTNLANAADTVLGWCSQPRGESCRFVVTPNVDHAVLFQSSPELQVAYSEASLVLADGAPLVIASRIFGRHLPERIAGSDLVPQIFGSASRPLHVFLLGAEPGIAERAAASIEEQWRGVRVVGTYSPPIGFETVAGENERIFAAIEASDADLLVIGLGAPKQELWAYRHRKSLPTKVAICAALRSTFSPAIADDRLFGCSAWAWNGSTVCILNHVASPADTRDAWVFPQLLWREWRRTVA